jgi:regulator of nucleoside diphosphate kinase
METLELETLELPPRLPVNNSRGEGGRSGRMITDVDRRRLGTLLTTREGRASGTMRSIDRLTTLLEDACSVAAIEAPKTLVTMNTTVELVDVETGSCRLVTMVYPPDTDDVPDGASVIEPLGLALIGCQVGDVLQCPDEPGRDFRITEIIYQPERTGNRHL